jgi:uncharacterized protein (DUF2147 family)
MKALAVSFFAASLVASFATPSLASDLNGIWMSDDGGTKVRMSDCGNALCGNIVWLKHPVDENGEPKKDRRNPDASKRNRPMLGLRVAHSFRPTADGEWAGTIYNADEGKTFKVSLRVESPTDATMKGCVLGVICKTRHWTRVEGSRKGERVSNAAAGG